MVQLFLLPSGLFAEHGIEDEVYLRVAFVIVAELIRNLVQFSTKVRINGISNRILVQISIKIRINICTNQKKVLTLQRFFNRGHLCSRKIEEFANFKICRYELHQT